MGDADNSGAIPQWSFSRLITFEACRYHAFLAFANKRPYAESYDREQAIRGQTIHTGAEQYIKGDVPKLLKELSGSTLVVERINGFRTAYENGRCVAEQKWGFDQDWQPVGFFDKNVWLRSTCDVVVDEGDLVEIADWKSGKRMGNEVKHSFQGMLYGITTLIKYPEAESVRIRFIYTDEGQEKVQTFTRRATMQLMPAWDQRARVMTSATVFPPKPNRINCRFCPYAPKVNGGDGFCAHGVEVPKVPPRPSKRMHA